MADTSHLHAPPPVEGDGVHYAGLGWFIVVLSVTTVFCMALVWGLFELLEYRTTQADPARPALARPIGEMPPAPNLLTNEPVNLQDFRKREEAALTTYGWADAANQSARIPVERAKELILQRGLPTRP
jgi:hypothetical protein